MERTRIAKVDDVKLVRRGEQVGGTLHLTPHHLIFSHSPNASPEIPSPKPRELWITYPIIQICTLRPTPPASHLPSSIRLRCRDFTFVCFCFADEKNARDVYDSIKAWTCKLGRAEKLYAFSYRPPPPEKQLNGWKIYDARREWKRLGISEKGPDRGWRISNINVDFSFSPTYPALLAVPSTISDNTLNYAGKYRSRVRLPVLTYLHSVNNCSITRSSQPLVGVRGNRSIQDEKLLLSIFSTSHSPPNPAETHSPPRSRQSPRSSEDNTPAMSREASALDPEKMEDEMLARTNLDEAAEGPRIYGAQQHNLIVDARPTVNALAMQAVGLGSENMDHYRFATKVYLGIDNIHVMRESLNKVIDALKESDVTPLAPSREALANSKWLKHINGLLDGASIIARQVALQHSHVLIHCSDGWDRTSQLSALSQLCLEPYYRTLEGFITLVEKDWLSFGHMFAHRSGFLSSEKWFTIENERIGGDSNNRQGFGNNNAIESALLSAKGFFNKDNNSRESIVDSDGELQPYDAATAHLRKPSGTTKSSREDKSTTKVKETSPVFHQFLDATYQLLIQHHNRFEFNERFLRRLLYHLYSCQYGTFLYNNEKERLDNHVRDKTRSVWDYFLSRREQFLNPNYDPLIDDNIRGKERLILPAAGQARWWHELFGRTNAEMNGRPPSAQRTPHPSGPPSGTATPPTVLAGIETADSAVGAGVPGKVADDPAATNGVLGSLAAGVAALSMPGRGLDGRKSPASGMKQMKQEMEVEMQ